MLTGRTTAAPTIDVTGNMPEEPGYGFKYDDRTVKDAWGTGAAYGLAAWFSFGGIGAAWNWLWAGSAGAAAVGTTAVAVTAPEAAGVGGACGAAILAARRACPGGDCRQLSEAFQKSNGGQLITLLPRGGPRLNAAAGVFSKPVGLHQAVQIEGGAVADPLIGITFPNVQSWVNHVVGVAGRGGVQVDVGGKIISL